MAPSRTVALAAALTASAACLYAAPGRAAEPTEHQKKLAALAASETAFKGAQATQGRQERPSGARLVREQDAFQKLCRIKPVMSDAEIDGCKRAYKL